MPLSTRYLSGLILLTFLAVNSCESANIVFLHHIAGYSHLVSTWNFAESLLSKGHNVTYIASVAAPFHNPSIPHIMPKLLNDYMLGLQEADFEVSNRMDGSMPLFLKFIYELNSLACEMLLSSPEFQHWLKTTEKVDLIYVDSYPECAFGLAYKFKAKLAIFSVEGLIPNYFENFGIPYESWAVPSLDVTYKTPLSFFEKVKTTLVGLAWRVSQIRVWNEIESSIKKHLEIEHLPHIDELMKSVSLIMNNGHYLEEYRRSLPPFVVSVPGMHVKEIHDPLPEELEKYINSSSRSGKPSEGFVYISLGSLVRPSRLSPAVKKLFYNSITAFPEIRFLWRWDTDEFPRDIPQNLKLSKWFNQQDLLGHPKIRGFVTQAGRPSSQEAIYNSVPMITFPVLGDQDYNANVVESLGISINLEIVEITQEQLKNAFSTLLYDTKLKERSKEVSKFYKDVPMRPLDTAVWWTEYILRHNDTSHLKPLAMDQSWYQRRLLDVWAFLAISLITFVYIFYLFTRVVITFVIKYLTTKIRNDKANKLD